MIFKNKLIIYILISYYLCAIEMLSLYTIELLSICSVRLWMGHILSGDVHLRDTGHEFLYQNKEVS